MTVDDSPSLIDMVHRSRLLGSGTSSGPPPEPQTLPVEILRRRQNATAEGYVIARSEDAGNTRVRLVLDHGLLAEAILPTQEAEWLGLDEGQIVFVRLDRATAIE